MNERCSIAEIRRECVSIRVPSATFIAGLSAYRLVKIISQLLVAGETEGTEIRTDSRSDKRSCLRREDKNSSGGGHEVPRGTCRRAPESNILEMARRPRIRLVLISTRDNTRVSSSERHFVQLNKYCTIPEIIAR